MASAHHQLATRIAAGFATLPEVEAVALAGSRGRSALGPDAASDIDLYVYTRGRIALDAREGVLQATGGASRADLGLDYWGPGDAWVDAATGIHVDVIYFEARWMEAQIERVVIRHEPSLGYSTALWYTVGQSVPLHDARGWFADLQARCGAVYPDELRRRIVAHNHPVLRGVLSSYANQLAKAVQRGDLVSVNHRLAGLLASYFDILFAVNRRLHPGEKRLLEFALRDCPLQPAGMADDVTRILETGTAELGGLPEGVDGLIDRLDALLRDEELLPPGP